MTTATATRAASVAEIHLAPINASRRRAGLPAMTLAEAEREFADVDRAPFRAKAVAPRTTSNTGAADAMWGGIVAKLNSSVPSRAPIAAGRTSPASSAAAGRVDAAVDWAALAHQLNTEAGLKPPARSAR
jgi:hypothetical protein